jgi:pilus assembly protein CpaE
MVALKSAKDVLLVTQLDLPCLRNIVRLMMSFNDVEGLKDKVKIIVNRSGLESGQISIKKAQETMGKDVYWQIPNDYRTMVEVRNNGVPLVDQAPKASITQAVVGLAEALTKGAHSEQKEVVDAGKSGSWLSIFGKGKTK